MALPTAKTCLTDGTTCYTAKTVPTITSINKDTVDTSGGTKVTIKGFGFAGDSTPVVTIGGVPCDVDTDKIKNDKIECTARASTASQSGIFVGSGGIIKRLYHNDGDS